MDWVSPKVASQRLNISLDTLRRWENKGIIDVVRSAGNHRRYNIAKYLNENNTKNANIQKQQDKHDLNKKKVIYARVSTRNQNDNLQRQIEYLRERYPNHELITDIGSGINFKRSGMQTILEYAYRNCLSEVVVAYRERLCRFGFELYEDIFKQCSNATIVVLNTDDHTPNEELTSDILGIITVYSAKINGRKKYTNTKRESSNNESKAIS